MREEFYKTGALQVPPARHQSLMTCIKPSFPLPTPLIISNAAFVSFLAKNRTCSRYFARH